MHKYIKLLCSLLEFIPWSLYSISPISCNILYFKILFVWYENCSSCFLLTFIYMEYLFPSSYFQSVCVSKSEIGLLLTACIFILFIYPFSQSVFYVKVTQLCPTLCDPRFLCPWDFLFKNSGVGCHFLLQRIFLTQGLNPGHPHCRQTVYSLSYQGSPWCL